MRVLIFPCGTGIGLEIAQALKDVRNIHLIGATSKSELPVVNPWLDQVYSDLHWLQDEKELVQELQAIVCKEMITHIFPGYDDAIIFLARYAAQLNPAKVMAPSLKTAHICRSKSWTYSKLQEVIRVPQMLAHPQNVKKYPVFVKPDQGQGSQDARKIHTSSELFEFWSQIKEPLICEYLPGVEYTVDCLSDRQTNLFVGPRERLKTSSGICTITKGIELESLDLMAEQIRSTLELTGVWFFQVKLDASGEPCLLEVAPRVAGCMAYPRGLGVNLPLLSLYQAEGLPVNVGPVPIKPIMAKVYSNYYVSAWTHLKTIWVDLDDTLVLKNKVNLSVLTLLYQCLNYGKRLILISRNVNPWAKLDLYKISCNLFRDILVVPADQLKSTIMNNYIRTAELTGTNVFIDDSWRERQDVSSKINDVICLDCTNLHLLLEPL